MVEGRKRGGAVAACLVALALALLLPARAAYAQFGAGVRMAVVSGANSPVLDPSLSNSNLRFTGGFLRFKVGHLGAEVSLDYRNDSNPAQSGRIKTYPLQATFLYSLLGGPVSPYALGGIGWYTRKFEALADGEVVAEALTRNMGYHAGAGVEVKLGRRAGIFVDYRYTFVDSGDLGDIAANALGSAVFSGLFGHGFSVANQGSMWTTGVAFYF